MRWGLKTKEALAITLLVLGTVGTTTGLHLAQMTRVVVEAAGQQADLIAKQVYAQSGRALARIPTADPWAALRRDRDLRSLVDASVGYSPHLLYVLIADHAGQVILHSQREREGGPAPSVPGLAYLLGLNPLRRFLALYAPGRIYEAELPVVLNGEPFGSVRLGISTSLLRHELAGSVRQSLTVAGVALPAAWLVAMALANLVLRPLRQLAQDVDRLRRGEFALSARAAPPGDEFGALAQQLQLLGQQLHSESLISYSAKLGALGRLTSGVAHEVKNPLNAMMIHLELAKERLRAAAPRPEAARDSLEVIGREIRRLDRVVQAFLKFVRPQELTLRPVDLNALVQGVVALVEAEWRDKGVRFAFALDPAVPRLAVDEELLRQAFLNIVLNAGQAMPSGGTVTLRTVARGREGVTVSVTDEGVGIPREVLDKIFALYYTTKPDGSGVGLSIVYRIVQMHDGAISVESEEGRGTTVVVDLPVR